jgi:hypothetical protein
MNNTDTMLTAPVVNCDTTLISTPKYSNCSTPVTDSLKDHGYAIIPNGDWFSEANEPAKHHYFDYVVLHAETHKYFEFGVAPACIFGAAIFAVFWGTLAGLLVKKTNMKDYTSIEACILKYGKTAEQIAQTGGARQATAQEVMDTLELVGIKITEGAKAFLYKEYIWLTIWSSCFAIVLGSTVDLLEMGIKRAPTNFPYTATSYLTGSVTSIIAGYIGMRIAVYTNTRVTFTCCSSVHKGFITAFRCGQVLGFVLVGLGVLNIMIIILLFKACWYNSFLKMALAAGQPMNRCPADGATGMADAQKDLWVYFKSLQHTQWERTMKDYFKYG